MARRQARLPATERLAGMPQMRQQPPLQALQELAEVYGDQWMAVAEANVSGAYVLKAIAAYFGVHSSPVSRAVKHTEGQQPAEQHCMIQDLTQI